MSNGLNGFLGAHESSEDLVKVHNISDHTHWSLFMRVLKTGKWGSSMRHQDVWILAATDLSHIFGTLSNSSKASLSSRVISSSRESILPSLPSPPPSTFASVPPFSQYETSQLNTKCGEARSVKVTLDLSEELRTFPTNGKVWTTASWDPLDVGTHPLLLHSHTPICKSFCKTYLLDTDKNIKIFTCDVEMLPIIQWQGHVFKCSYLQYKAFNSHLVDFQRKVKINSYA